MNTAQAKDFLDNVIELLNVMSFCLSQDMPSKLEGGSRHLFFLNDFILQIVNETARGLQTQQEDEDDE